MRLLARRVGNHPHDRSSTQRHDLHYRDADDAHTQASALPGLGMYLTAAKP